MDLIQRLREKNTGTIINREKDAIARKYQINPKFFTLSDIGSCATKPFFREHRLP